MRLSNKEAWEVLAGAHTGILTTLKADGTPISLPMWFVAMDQRVYVMTPARTKKVARVTRNPRVSFLVESGERQAEWAREQGIEIAEIKDAKNTLAVFVWGPDRIKIQGKLIGLLRRY